MQLQLYFEHHPHQKGVLEQQDKAGHCLSSFIPPPLDYLIYDDFFQSLGLLGMMPIPSLHKGLRSLLPSMGLNRFKNANP